MFRSTFEGQITRISACYIVVRENMTKVHFIPHAKYEIRTELKRSEVLERILSEISTQSRIDKLLNNNRKNFRGSIGTDTFKLRKILDHRNSWNPTLKGKLYEDATGTTIKLRINIHPVVLIFSIVWSTLILTFGLEGTNSIEQALWPLGMIIFLYVLTFIFFNIATEQAVNALNKAIGKDSP